MLDIVLINKLTDVLEKEASLYNGFLAVARDKTNIIIAGKVTELEEIAKVEQSYSERMQKLETEREHIIEQIASISGVKPSELTVTWIVENNSKSDETKKLKDTRDSIMNLVNELKKVNELNYKLLKNSLEYIDFSINLITCVHNTGSKYGNDGKEGKTERRSLFDMKL